MTTPTTLLTPQRNVGNIGRGALCDQLAPVEHTDPVGEVVGLLQVLGGEEDGGPVGNSSRTIPHRSRRMRGSRPVVGSSRKISYGPETRGIARSSRRFDPPEYVTARRPAASAERNRSSLDAARAGGIGRVVLLSSQGVGTGSHPSTLEDPVTQSDLEWTLLRPGGFGSNTLQWAEMVRARRMVGAPFGDVALPTIDPADIAEVAAVALRDAGHVGRTYELTGPASVSPRQQTMAIAGALGEPVRFVEQSRAEARAQMLRFMPEPIVEATLDILGTPKAAEQRVSPDVEQVLGRPPRTFAQWAARNVTAFTLEVAQVSGRAAVRGCQGGPESGRAAGESCRFAPAGTWPSRIP